MMGTHCVAALLLTVRLIRQNLAAIMLLMSPMLHQISWGTYTELFAVLASEVSHEGASCNVLPWGRVHKEANCLRKETLEAMKPEAKGDRDYGNKLWDW